MIRLCIEDYCHNCAFFKAEVDEPEMLKFDEHANVLAGDDYIIRCLHRERCAHAVKESKKSANTSD